MGSPRPIKWTPQGSQAYAVHDNWWLAIVDTKPEMTFN